MTPVELCNRALLEIGAETISELGTSTADQKACSLAYEACRDELLEMHPWGFATKRRILAESTEEVAGYTYVYGYPSDCLCAWEVKPYEDEELSAEDELLWEPYTVPAKGRNPFTVVVNATLTAKLIACDIENAYLIYTAKVENPTIYSKGFCAALVYMIALRIAPKLATDTGTVERIAKAYQVALASALTRDAREGYTKPEEPNAYVDARA